MTGLLSFRGIIPENAGVHQTGRGPYVENVAKLTGPLLKTSLPAKRENAELREQPFGTLVTAEAHRHAGQLDEHKDLRTAIADLKGKVDKLPKDRGGTV